MSLFIKGLSYNTSDESLFEYLQSLDAGEVLSVRISYDRDTGKSKGCVFLSALFLFLFIHPCKSSPLAFTALDSFSCHHPCFVWCRFAHADMLSSTLEKFLELQDAELDGRRLVFDRAAQRTQGNDRGGRGGRGGFDRGGRGGDRGGRGGRGGFGGGAEREKNPPSNVLFVGNLSFDVDNDTLMNHFPGCSSARVATNQEDGSPRGYAFSIY